MRVLVTGAGGFIGSALVRRLKTDGHWVRGIGRSRCGDCDEWRACDVRDLSTVAYFAGSPDAHEGIRRGPPIDEMYHCAADMGGIAYLSGADQQMARNNMLMDLSALEAARMAGVGRFLYVSSACSISPTTVYGHGKRFGEELAYSYDSTRIARLHTVYGPGERWSADRGKVVSSLCRKVAEAPDGGTVEVWGDGEQTRTFLYIDDAVDGLIRVMRSDSSRVIDVGGTELVSINHLMRLIIAYSGKQLEVVHVKGPQGQRHRGTHLETLREVCHWVPPTRLVDGLAKTYDAVAREVGR